MPPTNQSSILSDYRFREQGSKGSSEYVDVRLRDRIIFVKRTFLASLYHLPIRHMPNSCLIGSYGSFRAFSTSLRPALQPFQRTVFLHSVQILNYPVVGHNLQMRYVEKATAKGYEEVVFFISGMSDCFSSEVLTLEEEAAWVMAFVGERTCSRPILKCFSNFFNPSQALFTA